VAHALMVGYCTIHGTYHVTYTLCTRSFACRVVMPELHPLSSLNCKYHRVPCGLCSVSLRVCEDLCVSRVSAES
jgi:hypothetical protein